MLLYVPLREQCAAYLRIIKLKRESRFPRLYNHLWEEKNSFPIIRRELRLIWRKRRNNWKRKNLRKLKSREEKEKEKKRKRYKRKKLNKNNEAILSSLIIHKFILS